MDKLAAITYLLENGYRSNEWQEAGLLAAVSKVAFSKAVVFSRDFLDELVEEAANN